MIVYSGFSVECPYCGHKVNARLKPNKQRYDVMYCEPEDGGCDAHFVARVIATVQAEAFKIDDPGNINPDLDKVKA